MFSEGDRVDHFDDVRLSIYVVLPNKLENVKLNEPLLCKVGLVPDELDGANLLSLVVEYFDALAKGPCADDLKYLVSVGNMVLHYKVVLPVLVVESHIILDLCNIPGTLILCASCPIK